MFESVTGHEKEKDILINDIKNNHVSHAYLFSGIEGIGKKELALEFARTLLKTGNLDTCVDYTYIEKLPDKKEIIVEQVRNSIVNNVYIAPATCDKKVYIINDAELLNLASQNALLKTLEEPPQYIVIILITSNEKALLPTVISRLKKISFNKLSYSDIQYEIKKTYNKEIEKDKLKFADGSLKVAIQLIQDENDNKYSKIEKFYESVKKSKRIDALNHLEQISFKDEDTFKYLEYLMMCDKNYSKMHIIEKARNRMKQNANEDIVKQTFYIKMSKER